VLLEVRSTLSRDHLVCRVARLVSDSVTCFGNKSAHSNNKFRNGKTEFKENNTDSHEGL
jgi:hypothetical protein